MKRAAAACRAGRQLCQAPAPPRARSSTASFPARGRDQLEPDGHAGAIASDRYRDRAEPEIIDRDGVADDAAIGAKMAKQIAHPPSLVGPFNCSVALSREGADWRGLHLGSRSGRGLARAFLWAVNGAAGHMTLAGSMDSPCPAG